MYGQQLQKRYQIKMKIEVKTKRNVLLHCLTNLWILAVQRHYWRLQFHLVAISYPLKNISRLRKFFNKGIFICFIISHLGLYYIIMSCRC